ncbi:mannose-1-phosphate guanylyltransferase/mannose-6-phosphate isomerase [Neogemmobacter tilapiae]|uniref:Mannose-1-phosphate guanylyltransferase/mannose-6-phosphate isomerase n=1 Tax=Neogemmobacter tilapiae TaxID=875041 RepID=A0A918TPE1_9RHOB|nr:mannose-1-phosphate guanylyltransferase/mannose-6-phosphate isomerase [Gemmobacter tilapiae]GHC56655.1 mannose-1-phosphate guanylyltransferase/mannose-6-phosphate isomerase [Gemmobacter tilapiae]
MSYSIHPVILCGGMGSRLWPMSRVEQPKQFQPVGAKGSLTYFQTTIQRHRSTGFQEPIVVTNARHAAIVDRQMRELQLRGLVIAEPVGRNTGPAVLAAALAVLQDDPDGQLLVLPSDHIIKGDLNRTVLAMARAADEGRIVTFGIEPGYPETGFGYIVDGGEYVGYPGLHRVEQFAEKPNFDRAVELITSGAAYWASGISLFRADTLVEEFRRYDPVGYAAVARAFAKASGPKDRLLLEESHFAQATNQPTERIVFERSAAIALAPVRDIEWDDVGAWNAVHQISERCADNNVTRGDVITVDTANSLVQSDSRLVAVIGMRDVIVVETADAVLVAHRDHAQSVKQVVETLMAEDRPEVRSHKVRDTAWGQVEHLAKARNYEMRMLTVEPGASLRVNGTGVAPSMLTVISGAGYCGAPGAEMRIERGLTLPIAADHALPVRNGTTEVLRLIQLCFSSEPAGSKTETLAQVVATHALRNAPAA